MRYEIKARSPGEILDAAGALYRNHFVELLTVALLAAAPLILVRLAIVHGMTGAWALDPSTQLGRDRLWPVNMAVTFATLFAHSVQGAALASAVSDLYLGRPPSPWGRMVRAMPAICLAGAVSSLCIVFGLLLFVVPGVRLAVRWAVSSTAIVVEGRSGMAGLARSRELMEGRGARVVGLLFVATVLTGAITSGASLLVPDSLEAMPLVPEAFQELVTALVMPWSEAVVVLMYFDARVEREGFDLEMLAADLHEPAGGAPAVAPQA